jgi:TPP-dependent pyruvate/acetoin dehydrogenase alpha subunit
MHLFDASTRFYGGNAIVGGGLPLAVGLALADIAAFSGLLETAGLLDGNDLASLEQEVALEVEESVAFAEAGTWEPVGELNRFVYREEGLSRVAGWRRTRRPGRSACLSSSWEPTSLLGVAPSRSSSARSPRHSS